MSEIKIDSFDNWLKDDGPAALVFQRLLLPVEGKDTWIFPPTFAQSESTDDEEEGNGGSYRIDDLPEDPRRNVCLIDSVGSQANRMEPVFKQEKYAMLVPQRVVQMKDGNSVNILDAGHRAADAVVRFSKNLGPQVWAAFDDIKKKRDCSALAKLAPTSLVFGVWDSRATGVKIQRIVRSVIRAYNVTPAKRSATYQAAYDFTGNGMIGLDHDKGSGKNNPLSQEGFKYSLASGTHGGILVRGDIRQEAIINRICLPGSALLKSNLSNKTLDKSCEFGYGRMDEFKQEIRRARNDRRTHQRSSESSGTIAEGAGRDRTTAQSP